MLSVHRTSGFTTFNSPLMIIVFVGCWMLMGKNLLFTNMCLRRKHLSDWIITRRAARDWSCLREFIKQWQISLQLTFFTPMSVKFRHLNKMNMWTQLLAELVVPELTSNIKKNYRKLNFYVNLLPKLLSNETRIISNLKLL